jgi:two-component system, NtrC family, response regulator AtoC
VRRTRVLVVDDEPGLPDLVGGLLGTGELDVTGCETPDEAVRLAAKAQDDGTGFDVILLDYYLANSRGDAVIQAFTRRGIEARVILMSGTEPAELAIEALRLGAFDFVAKPLARAELRLRVERAVRDRSSDRSDKRRPRKSDVIIGTGQWIKELYERISMVAATDVTVAISGDSGTGKELVARTIHNLSPRIEGPFVVVNCAAIPEGLLEDELFGHVRGAFTDASRDREGLLAAAHGGTLFLDEIAEMAMPLQAKILRVLQHAEFRRIGDDKDVQVDVRVITATNKDLEQAVEAGTFREDLYYRINVFPLRLPPLRERKDDIPLLAQHFVLRHRTKVGKVVDGLSPDALARLAAYDFPGNVRELENKIHQALVMTRGPMIEADDLSLPAAKLHGRAPTLDLDRPFRDLKADAVDRFERDYIVALLDRNDGNLAAAARQAGMDRKNLWQLVQRHGIDADSFRKK